MFKIYWILSWGSQQWIWIYIINVPDLSVVTDIWNPLYLATFISMKITKEFELEKIPDLTCTNGHCNRQHSSSQQLPVPKKSYKNICFTKHKTNQTNLQVS